MDRRFTGVERIIAKSLSMAEKPLGKPLTSAAVLDYVKTLSYIN
jgi:hypothetical protein